MGLFVEADFDCGEVVVAAAHREAGGSDRGIGRGEEAEDLRRWKRDLFVQRSEGRRNEDGVKGRARQLEEGVGREPGAGAVSLPLVLEKAGVGVDVAVLRGVCGTGCVAAVLRVASVVVLGPETVQDEGGVLRALDVGGMRVAELG